MNAKENRTKQRPVRLRIQATGTEGNQLAFRGYGKHTTKIVCSTRGFSLPELMVTLVVSGLLMTGIVSGYIVQKRSYEDEASLIDMQLNGRLAMDRVAEIIRNAGLGCKDNFPPRKNDILEGVFNNYTRVFTVRDRNDGPDVLTVVSGLRRKTIVESIGPDYVVLREIKNLNGVPFFDLDKSRYIFFSPQGSNEFLQVQSVDGMMREVKLSDPCTTTSNQFCLVKEGDNVFCVNAYTVTLDQNGSEFIDVDDDGSVVDRDGDYVPDLYIYTNTRDLIPDSYMAATGQANISSAEVAQGIEALQFQFGWDREPKDGRIEEDEFIDDPTGNEADVRAVRIFLLARTVSPDPNYTDPNESYTLANHTLEVNTDERKYHRQLFVETVMVRNLNL